MPVVRIAAPAARQIARARQWWLEHRDKAPSAFDDDVTELFARLEERPELVGRPIREALDVRRVYLRRIRYYVYFSIVDDGTSVNVLAPWHGSLGREPNL